MRFQNTRAHKASLFLQILDRNNILYSKQFGFQNSHSTDHAVVQLVDQITF